MCEFAENIRGLLDPDFGIGVAKGHDVVDHFQNLFNCPRADDIMSQYIKKLQPPRNELVVREDKVLLWESPNA